MVSHTEAWFQRQKKGMSVSTGTLSLSWIKDFYHRSHLGLVTAWDLITSAGKKQPIEYIENIYIHCKKKNIICYFFNSKM